MRYDPDGMDNRDPALVELVLFAVEHVLRPWLRYRVRGMDRIPEGAALYVGNHNAALLAPEAFLFGAAVYRVKGLDDVPYGLAHEVVLAFPGLHELLAPLGAVRASPGNARRLFERGRKVLVFPGGDVDAMRSFRRRNEIEFGGRRGYVRLALRHGVPIVPLVTSGAHQTLFIFSDNRWLARLLHTDRWLRLKAFPVALSVPWGLTLGVIPPHIPLPVRVRAEVLEPIRFERSGEEAVADEAYVEACDLRVRTVMQEALTRLAAERRRTGVRAAVRRLLAPSA